MNSFTIQIVVVLVLLHPQIIRNIGKIMFFSSLHDQKEILVSRKESFFIFCVSWILFTVQLCTHRKKLPFQVTAERESP